MNGRAEDSKARESELLEETTDGRLQTRHKKLRLLPIGKLDFNTKVRREQIGDNVESEIREIFDFLALDQKLRPQDLRDGLCSVKFHVKEPEIYKVIDDFVLDCEAKQQDTVTFPRLMNFLNERLADVSTWKGCNEVFDSMKEINDITDKSLSKALEEIGEALSPDDVKYLMDYISDGQDPEITLEEFYYILSKKPPEADEMNNVTKKHKGSK